jgi:hypothetical protein
MSAVPCWTRSSSPSICATLATSTMACRTRKAGSWCCVTFLCTVCQSSVRAGFPPPIRFMSRSVNCLTLKPCLQPTGNLWSKDQITKPTGLEEQTELQKAQQAAYLQQFEAEPSPGTPQPSRCSPTRGSLSFDLPLLPRPKISAFPVRRSELPVRSGKFLKNGMISVEFGRFW